MQLSYDVVIIGSGGAGMMCALTAGSKGRRVLLMDHADTIGKKILISGGGRCNFTNIHAGPENYVSKNSHFCKSALARFQPSDFIQMVEGHGIDYYEKKLGQLFCKHSAQNIIDMFVAKCKKAGCEFLLNCQIHNVEKKQDSFQLQTSQGDYACDSLVVATGGLSIPKIGATGFGYDIARKFGLNIVEPKPALDGFTFDPAMTEFCAEFSGIALDSEVSCGETCFRENLLFTHKGLSGPAILQASLHWEEGMDIFINLLPDRDFGDYLLAGKKKNGARELKTILAEFLPKRFAERFLEKHFPSRLLRTLNEEEIKTAASLLHRWKIKPMGTVGFHKAEVTRGGVDTDELSSKTMEARNVPGLYFIGEVVDVTGWLGGFNFQWAWASGHAAGMAV